MSVSKFCEVTSALVSLSRSTRLHPFGMFSCLLKGLIAMILQHSGLCDVNPGDVVHMDSGETIAQWRKLYFQKFRVRCVKHSSFASFNVHASVCMRLRCTCWKT
jgi:hypothetical protein